MYRPPYPVILFARIHELGSAHTLAPSGRIRLVICYRHMQARSFPSLRPISYHNRWTPDFSRPTAWFTAAGSLCPIPGSATLNKGPLVVSYPGLLVGMYPTPALLTLPTNERESSYRHSRPLTGVDLTVGVFLWPLVSPHAPVSEG